MKWLRRGFLLAVVAVPSLGPALAAQKTTHPIQLSLFEPIQIVDRDEAVGGFRLNLIYGRNTSVVGLDIGLVNYNTAGHSKGVQFGVVGVIREDFSGFQNNLVNIVGRRFTGLQSGIFNSAERGEGVQYGIVNRASYVNGVQIGLVNYASRMKGLQIGLINIIAHGGVFPVLPIVNWSF